MWQNDEFGNNRSLQNNFHSRESYLPSSFGDTLGFFPGQQFLPNQQNIKLNKDTNGENFIENGTQHEAGLFHNGSILHNQFISPQFSPLHFSASQTASTTSARPPAQINARAAELKAELLKRQEGRSSPANTSTGTEGQFGKQSARSEGSGSLGGSPKTPVPTSGTHEQELNVSELISQYSETKAGADTSVKQRKKLTDLKNPNLQTAQKNSDLSAKSQAPSLGSPTKVTKPPHFNVSLSTNGNSKLLGHRSNESNKSETSEGEINEDKAPSARLMQSTKPQDIQSEKGVTTDEQVSWKLRNDQQYQNQGNNNQLENVSSSLSPPAMPATRQRARDDRRREVSSRNERHYDPDKVERHQQAEHAQKNLERDSLDDTLQEDNIQISHESDGKFTTLAELLPHDRDLREWLDITGYHNAPYRNKILGRRRAIAALDAQRERLLAEMEAEERGPIPLTASTPTLSILPVSILPKVDSRVETSLSSTENLTTGTSHNRVMSNKRPHSDASDSRDEIAGAKVARTDDWKYEKQVKEEDEAENRRLHSGDAEKTRRSSTNHRNDRHSPCDDRGSRGREPSPSRREYESKLDPRISNKNQDSYFGRADGSRSHSPRPFKVVGNYRGRAFDPNYRGRGRGRGRGDTRDSDPSKAWF